MRVVGIDPGLTGAATCLTVSGRSVEAVTIDIARREAGKREVTNSRALEGQLKAWAPDFIYFENVHAFKGQGIVAAGVMMLNAGIQQGICECAVAQGHFVLVPPSKWMARLGLLHATKTKSIARAIELLPKLAPMLERSTIDHNRAEATLIAVYGADRCDAIKLRKYG